MANQPTSTGQQPTTAGSTRGGSGSGGGAAAVKRAGEEVTHEGKRLAEEGQAIARKLVEDQQGRAADYLRAVAAAIGSGADELDRQGHGTTASYVSRTADEVKDLIDGFAQRDPGALLHEVQDFARRRPGIFFGAALLAGFGATRFLKASASEARREPEAGTDQHGTTSYGTTPSPTTGPQSGAGATQGTGASAFSSGTTPPVTTTPSTTRRL